MTTTAVSGCPARLGQLTEKLIVPSVYVMIEPLETVIKCIM